MRSQSKACVNTFANECLPTPTGPTKRKACGSRPCSSPFRRESTTRSWPRIECQGTVHLGLDSGGNLVGVARGIDPTDRRRVSFDRFEEPLANGPTVALGAVFHP